ncbi:MAG: DUF4127 family protein [Firmicutes bacterium]|nr:DUF4127 family protein [Bacillota bacterium]
MSTSRKKIIYLPLDERPCNFDFPTQMLGDDNKEFFIARPSREIMGEKKIAADFEEILRWLIRESKDAYAAIISIDTLVYGGIVPSRLHNLDKETLVSRLGILDKLKKANKKLKIYAFNLIMRCPQYSSSDEEPEYYETCGEEIWKLGVIEHKTELGIASQAEIDTVKLLRQKTKIHLEDYLARRKQNVSVNIAVIDKVGKSVDFLIIPQDDSSVYGYIAKDQTAVRQHVKNTNNGLNVLIYPGADEVGMTLLARVVNQSKNTQPTVSITYSSVLAHTVVPLYEDRLLGESVKYQILAAGGIVVERSTDSDIDLLINAPSGNMKSVGENHTISREYDIERNLCEFVEKLSYLISQNHLVAVADVAFVNGGDLELVKMMSQKELMFKVAAYSGWNTSGNTLGTAITQSMLARHFGMGETHLRFLALRYFEDVGYCSYVKKYMCDNILPELGLNYFDSGQARGIVSEKVKEEIEKFVATNLPEVTARYKIKDCYMPWRRMFETGLQIIEQ